MTKSELLALHHLLDRLETYLIVTKRTDELEAIREVAEMVEAEVRRV